MNRLLVALAVALLFFACKPGPPNGVMSERKMASVLYDYHVAKAMGDATDSAEIKARAYVLAALRNNGVTEAEFDSSMVWYSQHADRLYAVYKKVNERIGSDLASLGANVTEVDRYSSLSAKGDTANIWNGRSFYLLSSNGFNNRFTFEVKGDASMKPGDEYMLNFRAHFVQQEGARHGIVAFAIEYDNDSVSHEERHIYGSGDNSVSIKSAQRPVRRIYGYVYMMSEWREAPNYLFVFSPSLVRFHKNDEPSSATAHGAKPDSTRADSAKGASKPDSTKKAAQPNSDSLRTKRAEDAEYRRLSAAPSNITAESMHSTPQERKK